MTSSFRHYYTEEKYIRVVSLIGSFTSDIQVKTLLKEHTNILCFMLENIPFVECMISKIRLQVLDGSAFNVYVYKMVHIQGILF